MRNIFIASLALSLLVLPFVALGNDFTLYENNFEEGNLDEWTHIPTPGGHVLGEWSTQEGALQISIPTGQPAQAHRPTTVDKA